MEFWEELKQNNDYMQRPRDGEETEDPYVAIRACVYHDGGNLLGHAFVVKSERIDSDAIFCASTDAVVDDNYLSNFGYPLHLAFPMNRPAPYPQMAYNEIIRDRKVICWNASDDYYPLRVQICEELKIEPYNKVVNLKDIVPQYLDLPKYDLASVAKALGIDSEEVLGYDIDEMKQTDYCDQAVLIGWIYDRLKNYAKIRGMEL